MAEAIRFHLDPRCPWCWQTSKWVRRLHEIGEVNASWGLFSLEVVNFTRPIEEFDMTTSIAAPSQRTFVSVRESLGQDAASKYYETLGHRYFELEQDLQQESTVKGALSDAGIDTAHYDTAMADPATWEVVLGEHLDLVNNSRSFGVPTIRLDGGSGPAIFGPVISNPPTNDDDAVNLWKSIAWLTRYENFSELKRNRTIDPDLALYRTYTGKQAGKK